MTLIKFHPQKCFPPLNRSLMFDRVELIPGTNTQLSENQIQNLLSHPDLPRYQKLGAIEVIESLPESVANLAPEEAASATDLSGYDDDQTLKIIEGTHELSVLEGWLKSEKRRSVRQQLNRRITAIKEGRE